jgi:hypothetical protein
MKFIRIGIDGSGSSHTPLTLQENHIVGSGKLQHYKFFAPAIRKTSVLNPDRRPTLEIQWKYFIVYVDVQLYEFHAYNDFDIEEQEIPATNEQLEEIVRITHKYLVKTFEEKRIEFPVFPPIEEISVNAIHDTAEMLREALHNQLT